jgi:hypothetical protein
VELSPFSMATFLSNSKVTVPFGSSTKRSNTLGVAFILFLSCLEGRIIRLVSSSREQGLQ